MVLCWVGAHEVSMRTALETVFQRIEGMTATRSGAGSKVRVQAMDTQAVVDGRECDSRSMR